MSRCNDCQFTLEQLSHCEGEGTVDKGEGKRCAVCIIPGMVKNTIFEKEQNWIVDRQATCAGYYIPEIWHDAKVDCKAIGTYFNQKL